MRRTIVPVLRHCDALVGAVAVGNSSATRSHLSRSGFDELYSGEFRCELIGGNRHQWLFRLEGEI